MKTTTTKCVTHSINKQQQYLQIKTNGIWKVIRNSLDLSENVVVQAAHSYRSGLVFKIESIFTPQIPLHFPVAVQNNVGNLSTSGT